MLRLTMIAAATVLAGTGAADAALRNTGAGASDMPICYYTQDGTGEYVAHGFCNAPYSPARDERKLERPVEKAEPVKKPPCYVKKQGRKKQISDFFREKKGLRTEKSGKRSLSEKSGKVSRRAERAARKSERQAARAANRSLASNEGGRKGREGRSRTKADRGSMALEVQFLEPLL